MTATPVRFLCSAALLALCPLLAAAEPPPPEPDTAREIKEHRRAAGQDADEAREHARDTTQLHREEVRAKFKALGESAREHSAVVREELKDARLHAREHFQEAGQQLKAAGQVAREQLKGARDALHDGVVAGRAELKVAGEKLNQEFAVLRARADEARAKVWAQWRSKLRSREAIDARMQREFEKHARRQAKLQRIESLAREEADDAALERVARLKAREDDRHALRMKKLTTDRDGVQP